MTRTMVRSAQSRLWPPSRLSANGASLCSSFCSRFPFRQCSPARDSRRLHQSPARAGLRPIKYNQPYQSRESAACLSDPLPLGGEQIGGVNAGRRLILKLEREDLAQGAPTSPTRTKYIASFKRRSVVHFTGNACFLVVCFNAGLFAAIVR
jgi:hypothetical protein